MWVTHECFVVEGRSSTRSMSWLPLTASQSYQVVWGCKLWSSCVPFHSCSRCAYEPKQQNKVCHNATAFCPCFNLRDSDNVQLITSMMIFLDLPWLLIWSGNSSIAWNLKVNYHDKKPIMKSHLRSVAYTSYFHTLFKLHFNIILLYMVRFALFFLLIYPLWSAQLILLGLVSFVVSFCVKWHINCSALRNSIFLFYSDDNLKQS